MKSVPSLTVGTQRDARAREPVVAAPREPAVLHPVAGPGFLFLWAEAARRVRSSAVPRASGWRHHPRALSAQALAARLPPGVGHDEGAPAALGEAPYPELSLALATAHGEPLPSPAMGGDPHAEGTRQVWTVAGVVVPLSLAEPLLWPSPLPDPLLRPAPEWVLWWQVAAWTRSLVARGAVAPALVKEADGELSPYWRLVPGHAERQALAALAARLPAAATPPVGMGAWELVAGFAADYADALVRRALTGSAARDGLRRALRGVRGETLAWVRSLAGAIPEPLGHERHIGQAAVAWMEDPARLNGPPTLVLRLEEPTDGEPAPAARACWSLAIFLRPANEPTALIPAAEVWGSGHDQDLLGMANAERALVQALSRAGSAFGPLREAARSRAAVLALTGEQAWALLTDGVARLEAQGVAVLAPDFLVAPPRARLRLESAPPRQAMFTADALVRFSWEVALGEHTLSPEQFERLVAQRQPLCRLGNRWVVVPPALAERLRERWQQGARGEVTTGGALLLALQAGAEEGGAGAATGGVPAAPAVELLADEPLRRTLEGLTAGPLELEALAGFHGRLRPYQRRGLAWLDVRARTGLGGVLADEMGLGKTVQVLALLDRRAAAGASRPTLIVAPTSVVANWAAECARFTPRLGVLVHHGPDRARGPELAAACAAADLVLTSYPLLGRDGEALAAVPWDGVILDEAQNVKNASTKQAQAARLLRGAYRFALTGTPVENALSDLWSLFAFVAPGYLGSARTFQHRLAAPVERGGSEEAARTLRRLVGPLVLRRTKREPGVADELPPKIETLQRCYLTREQAALYEAVTRSLMERIAGSSGMARRAAVLLALLRLKQVCNHPAHYAADGSALADRSGKLARMEELLDEVVAEGERALVFTQFAAFGRRLADHLRARLPRCPVLYLDGATPAAERVAVIRRFQEGAGAGAEAAGPCVFVLSLKAGGSGLNLTAARHVFHFDRWWNPAVEQQATDRAHRIGQTATVQVHRLISIGTLEERIDELIRRKEGLAADVLGDKGEGWITELDDATLREIFTLRRVALG